MVSKKNTRQLSFNTKLFFKRIRRLLWAFLLFFLCITVGITGYMVIEGYTFIEAYYMTIITLSTVGFGEVHKLSDSGRIFTTLLLLFNLGIFAYSVSIISSFLVEGDMVRMYKEFRMQHKINQLHNHVIICGYGRHGEEIVNNLLLHKVPFVVIESDLKKIEEMSKDGNIYNLFGDATHEDTLYEVGIERAKALITTLPQDTDNVYITLTARQLQPSLNIISRALEQNSEKKLLRAGANHVIRPEKLRGFYMAALVSRREAVEFFRILSDSRGVHIEFEEIDYEHLPERFRNRPIRELFIREQTGVNVIGIKKRNEDYVINPSLDLVLEPGMKMVVLGDEQQIISFRKMMEIRLM